jgi:hypothetical protein
MLYPLYSRFRPLFLHSLKPTTMKRLSLLSAPLLAAAVFCFISCGDQDADDGSDATASDTTANASAPSTTPASTITTTPQHMMTVTHKVSDFDKWLAAYEAGDSIRRANGIRNYVIGRGLKDPNTVLVAVKIDDINTAKSFGKGAALKQAMQKSGVVGAPKIEYSVMTFQDTGIVNSDVRSRATFTVKDWARWQHSFDSSRQTGYDNGLAVRAYGHDADDDHKVTVVTAVMDSAKADAYWKSDILKQRRAVSGAGEAQRFLFRVVKRY